MDQSSALSESTNRIPGAVAKSVTAEQIEETLAQARANQELTDEEGDDVPNSPESNLVEERTPTVAKTKLIRAPKAAKVVRKKREDMTEDEKNEDDAR